jgi:hypothetical protein
LASEHRLVLFKNDFVMRPVWHKKSPARMEVLGKQVPLLGNLGMEVAGGRPPGPTVMSYSGSVAISVIDATLPPVVRKSPGFNDLSVRRTRVESTTVNTSYF